MKTRTRSYRSPPCELAPSTSYRSPLPAPVEDAPPAEVAPVVRGQSLTALNADILREVLLYVLEAPNGPTRPAILQVSSVFHELGHPLLFRHVRVATIKSWEAMFVTQGYLATAQSGGKGYGHRVREVQLDRVETQNSDWHFPVSASLSLPHVHTITLSHRVTETWTTHPELPLDFSDRSITREDYHHRHIPASLFTTIFRQLPAINTLNYLARPVKNRLDPLASENPPESGRARGHTRQPISTLVGLTEPCEVHEDSNSPVPISPFPWPDLRTVHLVGGLVMDDDRKDEHVVRSMAFSFLPSTVEKLVVSFADDFPEKGGVGKWVLRALLRGYRMEERSTRWAGVIRIEVRRLHGGARGIEERIRADWRATLGEQKTVRLMRGWNGTRKEKDRRLGEMVVFVDEDGTERRLVNEAGWASNAHRAADNSVHERGFDGDIAPPLVERLVRRRGRHNPSTLGANGVCDEAIQVIIVQFKADRGSRRSEGR